MNHLSRRIKESPIWQGVDETIAYTLTTTPWASSPTSPTVVIKNSAGTDVSLTTLTGSATVSGDVITTPYIHGLTAGEQYRLEIKWTVGSNVYEAWADLYGQT